MKFEGHNPSNLSGSLLVAHPSLLDPNFKKTIVLISADNEEEGALGVVINRPMHQTLSEFDPAFAFGALAEVPLYSGGPVGTEQMILAAWHWCKDQGYFKLFFGISEEKAADMMKEEPGVKVFGFLGYSGWSQGQLEAERMQNAWLVSPVDRIIEAYEEEVLWKEIIRKVDPDLLVLADAPDDPSLN